MPYAVAVGVGYAVAFALSFALNRVLNFRSHDPIGRQILVYIGVVAVNFAILIGVSPGLEAIGVQYQVARVAAGGCEDLFMYCAMRSIVFRGFDGAGAGRLSRGQAISTRSRTPSAAERSSRRPCPRSPGPPTIDT